MTAWRKGVNPCDLLERLSESRTINLDGSVSTLEFGSSEEWQALLETYIVDKSVSIAVKKEAIRKANHKAQDHTPTEFLRFYQEGRTEILRHKCQYIVAFPVWGRTKFLGDIAVDEETGARIEHELDQEIERTILRERSDQRAESQELFHTAYFGCESYDICYIQTEAHSEDDAFGKAYDLLRRVIAAISLVDGHIRWAIGGPRHPVASPLIAPQITVHMMNGKLAAERFWHTEWTPKARLITQPHDDRCNRVTKAVQKLLSAAQSSKWPKRCETALLLYYDAFSEHQVSNTVLGAWRLLEFVAGEPDVKSDVLIKRASYLMEDTFEMQYLGVHVRERRNALRHGREAIGGIEDCLAWQCQKLVNPISRHFIMNPFGFEKVEEFWHFLDMPTSAEGIRSKERVHAAAQKFRGSAT